MSYRKNSEWNDKNELLCLVIFKKLESENFPRGKQIEYCRDMEKTTNLDATNISAKICNFKSVAKINSTSHASKNTTKFYNNYCHLSISELSNMISKLP